MHASFRVWDYQPHDQRDRVSCILYRRMRTTGHCKHVTFLSLAIMSGCTSGVEEVSWPKMPSAQASVG